MVWEWIFCLLWFSYEKELPWYDIILIWFSCEEGFAENNDRRCWSTTLIKLAGVTLSFAYDCR